MLEHVAEGAVIISQTCDIVRDYQERRFVQIARVARVEPDVVESVRTYQRPRYAYIPALAAAGLVADLDVVATIDKADVSRWQRTPGCEGAIQQREFGYAVGRHKSRFAFPDEWTAALSKLRAWVQDKAKRGSEMGHFVRSVEQMRIIADDAAQPAEAEIICLVDPSCDAEARAAWVKNVLPTLPGKIDKDWCRNVTFRLATTDELTATEYLESIRLDFDAMTLVQAAR